MNNALDRRKTLKVLLIEDNRPDYVVVRQLLNDAGVSSRISNVSYDLVWAQYLREGVSKLKEQHFDVIILDMSLPDAIGLEGLHSCRDTASETPIIILTGTDDEVLASRALQQGAQDYLIKGQPGEGLARAIQYAIERQHILIELERAKAQALIAIEAKGMFLANMSHEIRTPLTAIVGFAETLALPQTNNEEKEMALNAVLRNSNHLLQLINDILDMSKIEAGNLEIEQTPCSPFQIISDIESSLRLKTNQKGIRFTVSCLTSLPEAITTDPTRLRQILLNLVGNAIKFTEKGEVSISVSWDESNRRISFAVKDTGIGISAEQQERLFRTFSQADASTTRKYGGTGLGLALSRRLAEKLGGGIALESKPGEGSTFTLIIHTGEGIKLPEDSKNDCSITSGNSQSNIPALRGQVLVVDDGLDNQELISFYLRKCGLKVKLVDNGQRALEETTQSYYDLILMDMQMPIMDGYEATQSLRKRGYKGPIVALTASILNESIKRCFEVGCNEHISKPFRSEQLFKVLVQYLPKSQIVETALPATSIAKMEKTTKRRHDVELERIIGDFRLGLPQRIRDIRTASTQRNQPDLKRLAHKLRVAGNFGFPTISEISAELEGLADAKNWENAEPLVTRLEAICAQIERAFVNNESNLNMNGHTSDSSNLNFQVS